jgi:hypothetical protein
LVQILLRPNKLSCGLPANHLTMSSWATRDSGLEVEGHPDSIIIIIIIIIIP